MRATRWRVTLGVLAFFTAVPALAQENIDAGKTPAELYAADCAICHKTPEGLSKAGGLWGLQNFLREHYTASKESAAAIAAYLAALDSKGSPREHTRTTRRARKGEKAKAEKAKAKEEKSKKTDEAKAPPVKPAEAKAKADTKPEVKSEAKTEAKSEAKPEKKPEAKPESKPAEAKAAPKDDAKAKPVEAKAEPKTNGAKAPDAKPEKKSD